MGALNEKLNLKSLFEYINSVYRIKEKINKISDKRKRSNGTPVNKVVLTVFVSFLLQYRSFREIFTYESSKKRIKKYIKGKIPKQDAARAVMTMIDTQELENIHDSIIKKIRENKTFRQGTIDGYVVAAIDGTELFKSKEKSCTDCLTRTLENGKTEYFHRAVLCMTVGTHPYIVLGEEMLYPRDGEQKDEGEITGGIRLIKRLYKTHHHFADVIVADALYLQAPFINTVISKGIDVVIRAKDDKRLIVKDALGLIKHDEGRKETFTKNKIRVETWDICGFEMSGVKSKLRFLQFREQYPKEKTKRTVWVVTTCNADYKTIWKMMHKRWDIENNGFHQLKTYYHIDHCYVHSAIENVLLLNIIAFNLREMYLYRRLRGFVKLKMSLRDVTITLRDDLLLNDYREQWHGT